MLLVVLTMYYQVICNILDTTNVWDHLSDYLLIFLRGRWFNYFLLKSKFEWKIIWTSSFVALFVDRSHREFQFEVIVRLSLVPQVSIWQFFIRSEERWGLFESGSLYTRVAENHLAWMLVKTNKKIKASKENHLPDYVFGPLFWTNDISPLKSVWILRGLAISEESIVAHLCLCLVNTSLCFKKCKKVENLCWKKWPVGHRLYILFLKVLFKWKNNHNFHLKESEIREDASYIWAFLDWMFLFVRTWKNHSTKGKYYEKGIEEFTSPNHFGYGEFVVEILSYFYTILLRFFFLHLCNSLAIIATL